MIIINLSEYKWLISTKTTTGWLLLFSFPTRADMSKDSGNYDAMPVKHIIQEMF